MMNTRILELVKNPELIQAADLSLLQKEISEKPYAQSIRALYLYGINQFDSENYKKELTTTAAYTTDKKILYQFINRNIETKEVDSKSPEENKEIVSTTEENPIVETAEQKPMTIKEKAASKFNITKAPFPLPRGENKPVFVDGQQNRILFEGEENFFNEKNSEIIDLESTQESGKLVTQKIENTPHPETEITLEEIKETLKEIPTTAVEETQQENIIIAQSEKKNIDVIEEDFIEKKVAEEEIEVSLPIENSDNITLQDPALEVIVPENTISEEKSVVEDTSELSFHGLDAFLPEVNIQSKNTETQNFKPTSTPSNKHEEEMKRLIEEVERKMREKKKTISQKAPKLTSTETPQEVNKEINFSETQEFSFQNNSSEVKDEEIKETATEEISDSKAIEVVSQPEIITEEQESPKKWQPMSFDNHLPDALLSRPSPTENLPNVKQPQIEEKPDKLELENKIISTEIETQEQESNEEEPSIPVMNLSFFSNTVSALPTIEENKKENTIQETKTNSEEAVEDSIKEEQEVTAKTEENVLDSNIPSFINTWQSWLKIDRTEEIEKQKTEIKNKAIDAFIENAPKISQLKDEVNFVVKEKTDDISHLMTETLANLYVEQKLYSKAISAFHILQEKYPEKQEHFENRIKEIKESRGKN